MAMNVPRQYGLSLYSDSVVLFIQPKPTNPFLGLHPIQYMRWADQSDMSTQTWLLPTQLVCPVRTNITNNAPGSALWL